MRVILCGGGTGGHINPALAVGRFIKERRPDTEIIFFGAKRGMEEKLVPAEGFELKTLDVSGFKRSFTPKAIVFNIGAAWRMATTGSVAKRMVRDFAPDFVFGTGGYASFPYIKAAASLGIPTYLHESNALPGKAVTYAGKYVTKILLGFPEAVSRLPENLRQKAVVTGNPIRSGMEARSKKEAKKKLGIDKPLVVSYFGSLGAREMNKLMAGLIKLEAENDTGYIHIHATGSFGARWMPEYVTNLGIDLEALPNIEMKEYIYNMPDVMSAADIVISRAGAMTSTELCATGTPSILIPSPNVAENHQESNARALERRGSAAVMLEKDANPAALAALISSLLKDPERLKKMSENAQNEAIPDATERIYNEIIKA